MALYIWIASEICMSLFSVIRVVLLLYSCLAGVALAAPRPYVVNIQVPVADNGGNYFTDLLQLILNASKLPDEVIQLHFNDKPLSQARWIAAVLLGIDNDVLWTMTNKEREKSMRAIRAPLLKGLMGYRLLVIRKGDEAVFASINTKEQLLTLRAGQGIHWPDTDILHVNQFNVIEAIAKENLYKMLIVKRFDFFPRGLTEINLEDGFITPKNLIVESHLMLHYPTDLYFFVNKKNTELATRLEKGWAIIQKNGEFEKFFLAAERVQAALAVLKKRDRTVIELDNPFLSEESAKLLSGLNIYQ